MRKPIEIRHIQPNPYRSKRLDAARVALLVSQIDKAKGGTGFWDNLLLRPHPSKTGTYQLAYGHHRLEALRRLGYKTIESAVRELSDADMVKIMADENLREANDPATVIETVRAAKDYLQGLLNKCETAKEFQYVTALPNLAGQNSGAFGTLKSKGVGSPTITAFLGERWKSKVEAVLRVLKAEAERPGSLKLACATDNMFRAVEAVRAAAGAELTPNEIDKATEEILDYREDEGGTSATHNTDRRVIDNVSSRRKQFRKNVKNHDDDIKAMDAAMDRAMAERAHEADYVMGGWRGRKDKDLRDAAFIREHIANAPPKLQQQFYDTVAEIVRDWTDFQRQIMADKAVLGLNVLRFVRKDGAVK